MEKNDRLLSQVLRLLIFTIFLINTAGVLKVAKLKIIKEERHPFYWGGFCGEWVVKRKEVIL